MREAVNIGVIDEGDEKSIPTFMENLSRVRNLFGSAEYAELMRLLQMIYHHIKLLKELHLTILSMTQQNVHNHKLDELVRREEQIRSERYHNIGLLTNLLNENKKVTFSLIRRENEPIGYFEKD